jgi:hypothetical protein
VPAPPVEARAQDAPARYADPAFTAWLGRAGGPARALAVNQLQRTVGNRRTGELLAAGGGPLLQRNPIAGAAGIEVVAGLAQTASFVSEAITQTSGSLSCTSPIAERLSSQPQPRKAAYRTQCLWMTAVGERTDATPEFAQAAKAFFDVEWEGNDYGEIGAARVRVNLGKTDRFNWSSAAVRFEFARNLVQKGGDARTWEMHWIYEGTYDPFGQGNIAFQGKFSIDAFGNFYVVEHETKEYDQGSEAAVFAGPNVPFTPPPPLPGGAGGAPAGEDEP